MSYEDLIAAYGLTCNILEQAEIEDSTGAPAREPYVPVASLMNLKVLVSEEGGDRQPINDKATSTQRFTLFIDPNSLGGYRITTRNRIELIQAGNANRELVVVSVSTINSMDRSIEIAATEQPV